MKRRTFLYSGLVAVAAFTSWELLANSKDDTIVMVLRRRLDYLTLDPGGVMAFARDISNLNLISGSRLHMLAVLTPVYAKLHLSNGNNAPAHALRHGEDRVVSTYLISSDFFVNGADKSRVVHYLGLLDPLRACGNPFARSPL